MDVSPREPLPAWLVWYLSFGSPVCAGDWPAVRRAGTNVSSCGWANQRLPGPLEQAGAAGPSEPFLPLHGREARQLDALVRARLVDDCDGPLVVAGERAQRLVLPPCFVGLHRGLLPCRLARDMVHGKPPSFIKTTL